VWRVDEELPGVRESRQEMESYLDVQGMVGLEPALA
jgi:hypothetical protein